MPLDLPANGRPRPPSDGYIIFFERSYSAGPEEMSIPLPVFRPRKRKKPQLLSKLGRHFKSGSVLFLHTVTVWFGLSVEGLASRVRVKSPHTKLGFRFFGIRVEDPAMFRFLAHGVGVARHHLIEGAHDLNRRMMGSWRRDLVEAKVLIRIQQRQIRLPRRALDDCVSGTEAAC